MTPLLWTLIAIFLIICLLVKYMPAEVGGFVPGPTVDLPFPMVIEPESMCRLKMEPGETLVIELPGRIHSIEQMASLYDTIEPLKKKLGAIGCDIIIVENGTKVSSIKLPKEAS